MFEYWYFHSKLWPRDWCSHAVGIMGVLELLRWRAPNPLILLLLLIQWNQQIPHTIESYLVFSYLLVHSMYLFSWFVNVKFFPMCIWPTAKDRQFVEVFSGVGEVSRAFRDAACLQSGVLVW